VYDETYTINGNMVEEEEPVPSTPVEELKKPVVVNVAVCEKHWREKWELLDEQHAPAALCGLLGLLNI